MEVTATSEAPFELQGDLWNSSFEYDEYNLEELYGPKRDSLFVVIPLTVIYVVIFVTGLVGNVSTCIVIVKNRSMHTATNYYLFSLAISDLLLLVSGLPPEVYSMWSRYPYIFGYTFCVLRGLFAETSANASVLTITAFTVERYVAICHPFLSHTMSKLSRVVKMILAIWFISICFAIPQALQFGTKAIISGVDESVICHVVNPLMKYSFEMSSILFFVLPMTAISVLYAMIGVRLCTSRLITRRRGNPINDLNDRNESNLSSRHQQSQSSKRVIKMLVAVVVAFFICWAPFHVQRLVATYVLTDSEEREKYLKIYEVVTYISGVLYFVSTIINPFLYNIMSNKFREAFKETFSWCCCRRPRRQQRSYSVLSRSAQRTLESTYIYRDESSLHTRSSITQKSSTDSINLPLAGRRSPKRTNLDVPRTIPRDRSEVCIAMVSETNMDHIAPDTRLVSVKVVVPPPSKLSRFLRVFGCAGGSNSVMSVYTPPKEETEDLVDAVAGEQPGFVRSHAMEVVNFRNRQSSIAEDELTAYMREFKQRRVPQCRK